MTWNHPWQPSSVSPETPSVHCHFPASPGVTILLKTHFSNYSLFHHMAHVLAYCVAWSPSVSDKENCRNETLEPISDVLDRRTWEKKKKSCCSEFDYFLILKVTRMQENNVSDTDPCFGFKILPISSSLASMLETGLGLFLLRTRLHLPQNAAQITWVKCLPSCDWIRPFSTPVSIFLLSTHKQHHHISAQHSRVRANPWLNSSSWAQLHTCKASWVCLTQLWCLHGHTNVCQSPPNLPLS